jgi:tetratricopeptide (TPR) repeat protein
MKKCQYCKAIADFTKAIEINPNDIASYLNRGVVFGSGEGQFDEAISDFNKAIELNPKYVDAYYNRAIAYFNQKEYSKAWSDVYKVQVLGDNCHPGFIEALRQASGREK